MITCKVVFCQSKALSIAFFPFSFKTVLAALLRTISLNFCFFVFKSESMQKSTKIADSWQGSKNQNRSSFADWYTLVSLQTLCSFFFERSIRFREKRRKPFQAPPSISQAKNRVEIHHDSLDSRSNTAALGKKLIAKILSLTRR